MSDVAFDFDAWYGETRREPFTFTWAGEKWSLPHFSEIDWRVIDVAAELEALASADENAEIPVDLILKFFQHGFRLDPEQAARWEQVPQPIQLIMNIFDQWQKHAGADLGELLASSDSSASTERPLKLTSRATTRSVSRARSTGGRKRG
ncbi:hypothetical protein [Polymorphospora lycopeni]|uniref:Uncharacterized protein n=1 Tax=Polymorphospora lycopeni TaxID=3140240 RepID=A0ABV5CLD3_9ACTN